MRFKAIPFVALILLTQVFGSPFQTIAQVSERTAAANDVATQKSAPICATKNLDIRVLPEFTLGFIHIVPIEFSNVGMGACNVPQELAIALTSDQTEQLGSDDGSPSTKFIRSGETVHSLLVWSPKPREGALCPTYDGFELTRSLESSPRLPPMLTARHIEIRACQLFSTAFRSGSYVPGEKVPTVWFDSRPHPKPLRIANNIKIAAAANDSPVHLDAPTPQPVLGNRVNLLLRLPKSPLPSCPYAVLRARRSNGETFAYFDRCDTTDPPPPAQGLLIALRPLDLMATTGEIRFDVITQTSTTTYTQSPPVTINIRNGQPPALPAIADENTVCTSEDLKLSPAVAPLHNESRVAEIFEFRNNSGHTCRIGGVPRIEPLNRVRGKDGRSRTEAWPARICPNCDDSLFSSRPNVWIDLAPGESAHFLVGHTLSDLPEPSFPRVTGVQYGADYTVAVGLQWEDGKRTVQLRVRGVLGEPLDVSAWRAGPFDNDPRNTHWHAPLAASTPAPTECKSLSNESPQPADIVFFPEAGTQGLRYGLSLNSPAFHLGDDLLAHMWVTNATNEVQYVDTCNPSFPTIAVFDTQGHRILIPDRQSESPHFSCLRSMTTIGVAPHSCVLLDAKERLGSAETLPPGDYIVTTVEHQPANLPTTIPGLSFKILNERAERSADYDEDH